MKKGLRLCFVLVALAAAWLPRAALAAETETGKKASAVVGLSEMKNQLTSLQGQISSTLAALERVKAAAQDNADLTKPHSEFAGRLKTLDGQVELIRRDAITVKARAKDHYEGWQKEIANVQNPKIREKAQERFADARKQFDKIIASADEAKQQTVPFFADLKDIGIYLEADLSANGVKSLSSTIWKLGNKTKSVQGSITDLIEQIDRTISTMPKT